ncbi:class I adenylate-forming enzyme family protein [Cytobacillus horneckiae]|uniref:class I adenylate-forming enzyme family protein n=1 Tax=Cytobacillus horneckiae TaxID=549687 RepID=UPI003D9A2859
MDISQKKNSSIIYENQVYSHNRFKNDVISYSMVLLDHGIVKGDRVILCCNNNYTFLVSLFSLMHINCSIVLLDLNTNHADLKMINNKTKAKWILTEAEPEPLAFDGPKYISLATSFNSIGTIQISLDMEIELHEWYHRPDAIILFSSGSTGIPKGMVKSGASLFNNMNSTAIGMGYKSNEVILPVVPFFNIWGLNMIIQWWVVGCTIIICNYQSIRTLPAIINNYKISVVEATIATTYLIVQIAERNRENVHLISNNIRMWFTSGAPVPQVLKNKFEKVFKIPLLDYYGSSEAGNLTSTNLNNHNGTGKVLEGLSVKVFDESFNESKPGEIGHIYAKGNGLMEGYLDNNGNVQLDLKNSWLDMKDFGYFDIDGNLFVIGRRDGAIHRMGATFYACHMERIVEELGILSKVVSFTEDRKGSYLILFIQYSHEKSSHIRKEIVDALPTYMYPDKLICIDEFPFLPNGKIDNKQLEEYALNNLTVSI